MEKILQLEAMLPLQDRDLCEYLWNHFNLINAPKSEQEIIFIARLIGGFLKTEEGINFALRSFEAKVENANYLHTFYQKELLGDPTGLINPKELIKFSGWIYRKKHALHADVVAEENYEQQATCDSCGGSFPSYYCTLVVDVEISGRRMAETLCNHCRSHSEDSSIKSSAIHNGCRNCLKTKCHNHPNFAPKHVSELPRNPFKTHLEIGR